MASWQETYPVSAFDRSPWGATVGLVLVVWSVFSLLYHLLPGNCLTL